MTVQEKNKLDDDRRAKYDQKRRQMNIPSFATVVVEVDSTTNKKKVKNKEMHLTVMK